MKTTGASTVAKAVVIGLGLVAGLTTLVIRGPGLVTCLGLTAIGVGLCMEARRRLAPASISVRRRELH